MTPFEPCRIDSVIEADVVEEKDRAFFLLNTDVVDTEVEMSSFQG